MSSTSISDNKPHLNNDLIKSALVGSKDYHYLMTAIVHESLMLKAGYIPEKLEQPLPAKNPEHWQTKKHHINAGNLWVFFATEYGQFLPAEAKRVWRYGQLQILRKQLIGRIERSVQHPNVLTETLGYIWLNPREFVGQDSFDGQTIFYCEQSKTNVLLNRMQNKYQDWRTHPNFGGVYSGLVWRAVDWVYGRCTYRVVDDLLKLLYPLLEDERREWSLV